MTTPPNGPRVSLTTDPVATLASIRRHESSPRVAELEEFVDNAPVGVHFVNVAGTVEFANRADLEMSGFTNFPSDTSGTTCVRCTPTNCFSKISLNTSATARLSSTAARPSNGPTRRLSKSSSTRARDQIAPASRTRDASCSETTRMLRHPRLRTHSHGLGTRNDAGDDSRPSRLDLGLALDYVSGRKRAEEALGYLAAVGRTLAGSSDLADVLQQVAELSVPYMADWCQIRVLPPASSKPYAVAAGAADLPDSTAPRFASSDADAATHSACIHSSRLGAASITQHASLASGNRRDHT